MTDIIFKKISVDFGWSLNNDFFAEQSTQPKLFHTSTILQYRDRQRRGVFADDEDFNREIIDDNNDGFERGK